MTDLMFPGGAWVLGLLATVTMSSGWVRVVSRECPESRPQSFASSAHVFVRFDTGEN